MHAWRAIFKSPKDIRPCSKQWALFKDEIKDGSTYKEETPKTDRCKTMIRT